METKKTLKLNDSCMISVVMPVYNADKFLSEAIASILNQTFKDFEFIIINDCSTDHSWDVVKSFSDDRLITIQNEKNIGTYPSRNKGMKIAKGKYIAVMDADDIALPDRLEKQYSYMDRNPEILATGTLNNTLGEGYEFERPLSYHGICASLLDNNYVLHPSMLIRADSIREFGGYDEQYVYASDYDLVCKLSLKGMIENLPDICMTYRWHPDQITLAKRSEQQRYADIIRQKYQIAIINKYRMTTIPEVGEAETGHPDIGRVLGLHIMGVCINPLFQVQANRLLYNTMSNLHESIPLCVKRGLIGICSGLLYLMRNHFIERDEDKTLTIFDNYIMDAVMNHREGSNLDLEGIYHYMSQRVIVHNRRDATFQKRIEATIQKLSGILKKPDDNILKKKTYSLNNTVNKRLTNEIEVVIINWKRNENVVKMVEAMREQTVSCTITLCDCHPSNEYALPESTLQKIDRLYRWEHNLGGYNRYLPTAGFDHNYTFFMDDDLLPSRKCLEFFLSAASKLNDQFGVLGQYGRMLTPEGRYSFKEEFREIGLKEVDFIVQAYFVKTGNLHHLLRFRWEIGYFEDELPEDDLLLCSSLKYYNDLRCYLLPLDESGESLLDNRSMRQDFALCSRPEHLFKRQRFIDRIIRFGWKPLNLIQN